MWYGDQILHAVRRVDSIGDVPQLARRCKDRHEVFSVARFKRTLGQYESFEEVERAMVDILEGMSLICTDFLPFSYTLKQLSGWPKITWYIEILVMGISFLHARKSSLAKTALKFFNVAQGVDQGNFG